MIKDSKKVINLEIAGHKIVTSKHLKSWKLAVIEAEIPVIEAEIPVNEEGHVHLYAEDEDRKIE